MREIFPLLGSLSRDSDDQVRKSCIKQIPSISKVVEAGVRSTTLCELFFKLLQDPDTTVRLLAYQNFGKFLVSLDQKKPYDKDQF